MQIIFFPTTMAFETAIKIDHNAHGYRRAIYVHGVPYAVRNGQLIRAAW